MPGINLDGLRVAEVRPTVGTLERTPLTRPDFGGLLSAVAGGAKQLVQYGQDKAEASALDKILEPAEKALAASGGQGTVSFEAGKTEDVGLARATAVEEETGITLDAGDKTALQ